MIQQRLKNNNTNIHTLIQVTGFIVLRGPKLILIEQLCPNRCTFIKFSGSVRFLVKSEPSKLIIQHRILQLS